MNRILHHQNSDFGHVRTYSWLHKLSNTQGKIYGTYWGNIYGIYREYIRNIHKYLWYKRIRAPLFSWLFDIINTYGYSLYMMHKYLWGRRGVSSDLGPARWRRTPLYTPSVTTIACCAAAWCDSRRILSPIECMFWRLFGRRPPRPRTVSLGWRLDLVHQVFN